jgi:hypothetical protein
MPSGASPQGTYPRGTGPSRATPQGGTLWGGIKSKFYARFVFTFHMNNLNLFEQLHNYIGSGFFKTGTGNSMRYVVADKKGVIKLVNLMNPARATKVAAARGNGYFRTPAGGG